MLGAPGWHRRHRLAAGELQTKPLEGDLDFLKLTPDRGRLPTLRQESDQIAGLTFQSEDLGLYTLDPAAPLPEDSLDVRVDQLGERRHHRRRHRGPELCQHGRFEALW
jgi:hypothetical protein